MAIYEGDTWTDRPADGFEVSFSVRLLATPGHTAQDITTLVDTPESLVACTLLWWSEAGPDEDPLAEDQDAFQRSRGVLLALEPALIVPGHGAPSGPSGSSGQSPPHGLGLTNYLSPLILECIQ